MPKQTKKAKDSKEARDLVLDSYKEAWNYTQGTYHDTWLNCWKLYNNQRIDRAYEGVANNFVPMTFSTIETMVASLAGGRPKFDFVPTKEEQQNETKVLNSLLDYYWDADQWHPNITKWIRAMLMYGTAVMYVFWDMDRPRLVNIPLRDFWVDPRATDPDSAEKMGRRYLVTLEELKSFTVTDPDTGEQKPMFDNLDKVKAGMDKDGEELDKEEKDQYLGSTLGDDAKKKQIEVIEYWSQDRVIALANRDIVIRDEANPYKLAAEKRGEKNPRGLIPFIVQRDYVDESLFYGRGEIEPIMGLQENLNDLTNQNQDAITYALNPMFTIDPEYADIVEEFESIPGAIYTVPAGTLNPINMGNTPADAFNERFNLKNEIREATSADQITKGVSGNQNQTATEIVTQVQQSGQRFGLKLNQIENEGYNQLARIVLRMVQLYVTEPIAVRVAGKKQGVDWEEFDPEQFKGDYEPRVQLESTVKIKNQQEIQAAQDMYLALVDNESVNQDELTRLLMKKVFELDEGEVDKLLTPPELTELIPELATGEISAGGAARGPVSSGNVSTATAAGGANVEGQV